jgi:hypothetical protein
MRYRLRTLLIYAVALGPIAAAFALVYWPLLLLIAQRYWKRILVVAIIAFVGWRWSKSA